jgi:hypothetical protein
MAGASAQGIRAGRAYVELYADQRKLAQGLDQASAKLKGWAAGIAGVGAAVAAAGALLTAPFVAAVKTFVDTGTQLTDMSARTGVAVESLSTLKYAAEASGGSLEEVEHAMRHLSRTQAEANAGHAEAISKLAQLGLTAKDLQGLSPDAVFRKVGAALGALPDQAQRSALAMELFGREGQRLLAMFGNTNPLEGLAKALEGAAVAGSPAAAALSRLNLTAAELQALNPSEAFQRLAVALQTVEDPGERSRLALEVLGQVGAGLAPPLQATADKMRILGQTVAEAAEHAGPARAALGALGLSVDMLAGLTADQRLQLLQLRLQTVADPAARSALELQLFGRAAGSIPPAVAGGAEAVAKLHQSIADAAAGSKPAADAIGKLGLKVDDLKALSADDQVKRVAKALGDVSDPAQRSALAIQLFGKSANNLANLEAQLRGMGAVMSTADAAAGKELGTALKSRWAVVQSGAVQVGAALAPQLLDLAKILTQGAVAVVAFIREHKELIVTAAAVAAGIAAAGAALLGTAAVVSAAGTVFGVLGTAIAAAGGAVMFLVSPLGLVVVGLAAAGAAVLYFTGTGGQALEALGEAFGSVKDTAVAAWGGIKDALAAGDLMAAARVAWTGVKAVVLENTQGIQSAWVEAQAALAAVWVTAQAGAEGAWAVIRESALQAADAILGAWDGIKPALKGVWDFFMQAGQVAFDFVLGEIRRTIALLGKLPGMGELTKELLAGVDVAGAALKASHMAAAEAVGKALEPGSPRAKLASDGGIAGALDEIGKRRAAEFQGIEDKRRADLEAIPEGARQAMQDFQDAVKAAADAADAARNKAVEPLKQVQAPDQMAQALGKADVHGTFSALGAAAMGSDHMADVAKNTAAMLAEQKKTNRMLPQLQTRIV